MKRSALRPLLVYGLTLGLLLMMLKLVEYRYLVKTFSIDVYLGGLALVFTSLGIWIGYQMIHNKKKPVEISQIAYQTSDQALLSERESEVLIQMAEGWSNREIASHLFISIHTVKTHSTNIFSKLGVKRRTQTVSKARALGLISNTSNEEHPT